MRELRCIVLQLAMQRSYSTESQTTSNHQNI